MASLTCQSSIYTEILGTLIRNQIANSHIKCHVIWSLFLKRSDFTVCWPLSIVQRSFTPCDPRKISIQSISITTLGAYPELPVEGAKRLDLGGKPIFWPKNPPKKQMKIKKFWIVCGRTPENFYCISAIQLEYHKGFSNLNLLFS